MVSRRVHAPEQGDVVWLKGVSGVILADQVRNLDWEARGAEKIGRVPDDVLAEVAAKLTVLMPTR